jgi:excisionase family DNA binding protein
MKLYSLKEVAEMLGVTYNTVWNLINTDKIKAVKVGRVLRVEQSEVERIMKEGA